MRKVIKIKYGRIFILLLILISTFLIYSFYNKKEENTEMPVNGEVNENFNTLILVNKDNKLPADYTVNLVKFQNYRVAEILIEDLNEMYTSAKNENILLKINTTYRTESEQKKIFDDYVSTYIKNGDSYTTAVGKTNKLVANPGYSEHETGLAIDFTDSSSYNKKLEMWQWLDKNAYKYGFILRYPKGKEYITGYDNEQWHYRYVGKKYARIIYESELCLEEYLNIN